MLRQYEMLKQGDVFLEKVWDEKFVKEKKFQGCSVPRHYKGHRYPDEMEACYRPLGY